MFAPVPHPDKAIDLKNAREINDLWREARDNALELWKKERAEFKKESEARYLEERDALLKTLAGKKESARRTPWSSHIVS